MAEQAGRAPYAPTMTTAAATPLRAYSGHPNAGAAAAALDSPRVVRLEAQLRDARIRASEAEEVSRARGQDCGERIS